MDNNAYINATINNSLQGLGASQAVQSSRALVNASPAGIDEAARQFEAMFIAQMLRPIFDTVPVDERFGGGQGEEVWRDFLVEEYSKAVAERGGLGIADSVRTQLLKLQEIQP